MSEKRRDSHGRLLRENERQRSNGCYEFRYIDSYGEKRSVYSWRLVATDNTPAGKKGTACLRDLEKEIRKNLEDGISSCGGGMTVLQLCERYIKTKTGVKPTTETGYKTVINILKASPFGRKRIDTIKISDAKIFLIDLQQRQGKSYSSIHSIKGVLRPAFQMACDDDLVRKNPFDWQASSVLVNDAQTREAISKADEKRFLSFFKEDMHFSQYYDGIFILLNTGMRISELCGLTISDIDLKKKELNIDHQLQRKQDGTLFCQGTKTNAGTRVLPLEDSVCEAFKRVLNARVDPHIEPMVDGYCGFIFLNYSARKGLRPMVAMDWEHIFKRICDKYNSVYRLQLPVITPHVCRHTYCSNKAKSGMNPKVLQYLMGHSEIGVTLNTYTHLGLEAAEEELDRLNNTAEVVRMS